MIISSNAQESIFGGLNIGVKAGTSRLITEFPKDFSESINEFDNKSGLAIDVELSKYLTDHWEIGMEINYSVLNGETDNPKFSADGHHSAFLEPITGPVEYNNILMGQKFFFRYYFISLGKNNAKVNFKPFVRGGMGYLYYKSKFKYIDPNPAGDDIIFGKGIKGHSNLSTAVYNFGTGFKTSLSSKLYIISSVNLDFVNYDFLDVVHNYNEAGERRDLIGVYTELKIGIFYNITTFESGKGRSKKSSGKQNLPFAR